MSKMTIDIDEDGLIKGKYDGLGKMNVDVEYVKDLVSTCQRLTLRNNALMHDLAEATTERDKLLKALGAVEEHNGEDIFIDSFISNIADIFSQLERRKSL
jgi:uncharacterized protein (DUF362 family)